MYKVILADDDYMVLEGLEYYLDWASLGLKIVAKAEDGLDALKKSRELEPDLIISDVVMPGIPGTKLAEMAKEERPNTQVIMISAHQDFSYIKAALKSGTVDYLLKPFDREEFEAVVKRAIVKLDKLYEIERLAADYSRYLDESLSPLESDRLDELQEKLVSLCGTGQTEELKETIRRFFAALREQKKESMIYLLSLALNLLTKTLRRRASDLNGDEARRFLQSLSAVKTMSGPAELEAFFSERLLYLDMLTGGEQASRPRKVVRDLQALIHKRYFEPLTIAMLAQEIYMSVGYIQILFKKETGMTINDYITQVRVDSARELLKDSSIRIYDVANLVGYQDTNYFTKIFKKHVGMNPLDYREHML